jgi:Sec-independent protein translocase protein TatA
MDILGIGPLELGFVLLIALIFLGPREIVRFARSAGRVLNRIYRSEVWGAVNRASQEFRNLPNRLAREAALDDLDASLRQTTSELKDATNLDAWTPSPKHPAETESTPEPPPEAPPAEADDS